MTNRRKFIRDTGLGALAFDAAGATVMLTPRAARATGIDYSLVDALWRGDIAPWDGPPPPLFYMMVRSDAVDVVYGTQEGFDELNVPYLAHIVPPEKW